MTRKGMMVDVFKSGDGDFSNGGVSARHRRVLLVGPGVAEVFEEHPDVATVELLPANIGTGYKAVPVDQPEGMVGPMFGGAFIWTSDSRFRRGVSEQPIALHDRWETAAQYASLSS